MLLIALALIVFGIFLMFESSNMLFQMNPQFIIVMLLAALFVFSGIILAIIAMTTIAVF
jgi:hypothetical protein